MKPAHRGTKLPQHDCRKLAWDWPLCPKALFLGRVDIAACPGLPHERGKKTAESNADSIPTDLPPGPRG